MVRPFRFAGYHLGAGSAAEWAEGARRIESLGYHTLVTADHFMPGLLAPVPAIVAAALATRTLRVGLQVFANDFHHPAVLAKEAATIDVLSGGRFEFGIGAGYNMSEYRRVGIPFDPPGIRVGRMEEALRVIKGLWAEGPFTFAGRYYAISEYDSWPKPVQRPHPPVFIGAGSKRLLSFAAREADIVGIVAPARFDSGHFDQEGDTEARLTEQVSWVRDAAGARFESLELAVLLRGVSGDQ